MATYGNSFYGVGLYGPDTVTMYTPAEYSAAPFTATPQGYGDVALKWSMPTAAWSELRILRSTSGTPNSSTDGTLVTSITERDTVSYLTEHALDTGHWYYYAIYIYDPAAQAWVFSAAAKALVPADYGYAARLWDLLPVPFKSTDLTGVGNAELPENQQLYQFLRIFGFIFDSIRTQADSLLKLPNPRLADESMLQAALAQYGFEYEPQFGATAMRKLLRNAVHLYQIKGTATGAADLVATLTGWRTSATMGKNLALDNVQAGMAGGIGQWGQFVNNVTAQWQLSGGSLTAPAGDGILVGQMVGSHSVVQIAPTDALQGIPITAGQTYTASIYVRLGTGIAGTWTARLAMDWVNRDGSALGASAGTVDVTADGNWHRITATGVAHADALFGLPSLMLDSTSSATDGQEFYFAGFQLEQAGAVSSWECARKLWLTVEPDLINEIPNASGAQNTDGWINTHDGVITREVDSETLIPHFKVAGFSFNDQQSIRADSARVAAVGGDVWTIIVEMQGSAPLSGVHDQVILGVTTYAGDGSFHSDSTVRFDLPADQQAAMFHDIDTSWRTIAVEYTVPASPTFAYLEPTIRYAPRANGNVLLFRRATFVRAGIGEAFTFDAGDPSSTQDYAWEGTPYASRSMYFSNRSVKVARLEEIVPRFLPVDRCWGLAYAPGEPTTAP